MQECAEVLCVRADIDTVKRDRWNRTPLDVATPDCKEILLNRGMEGEREREGDREIGGGRERKRERGRVREGWVGEMREKGREGERDQPISLPLFIVKDISSGE